jgi:hypothetical protein
MHRDPDPEAVLGASESTENLKRTPLYDLHVELGGKMVPFAGYEMPVQYPMGILTEHQHTRSGAGLFDVSHMGQVRLRGESFQQVASALERLCPADFQSRASVQPSSAARRSRSAASTRVWKKGEGSNVSAARARSISAETSAASNARPHSAQPSAPI